MLVGSLVGRTVVDRYEVTSLLNAGGMGAVYRARQRALDRSVAIKFIHHHLLRSPVSIQRFMVEAQTLSRMQHPHVVSVYDFGRMPEDEGGCLFLVMELLSGPDLADVLQADPLLPLPRVIDIIVQLLEGLAEVHHAGITHRDVKPENVILEPLRSGRDHVKLIDFGVARFGDGRTITQGGMICGTPEYMAPEQVRGAAGPAVDIYSTGVMLYQMLTGGRPTTGRPLHLPGEVMLPPPDPRKAAPQRGIPEALAEICMRAMEAAPERRFPDVQAFVEAIRGVTLGGGRSGGEPVAWDRPSWPSLFGPAPPVMAGPPATVMAGPPATVMAGPPATVMAGPPASGPPDRRISDTLPAPTSSGAGPAAGGAPASRRPRDLTPPDLPLFGRQSEVQWACELLFAERSPPAVAFWGRAGVGRSRLAREVGAFVRAEGAFVASVRPDPPPFNEIGYRGLRQLVRALIGRSDEEIVNDSAADRWSLMGLRMLFSKSVERVHPSVPRRAAAAALAWSVWRASCRGASGRVLLIIDDVDRLDGASLLALRDLLAGDPMPGFNVLVTSAHARAVLGLPGARERALRGLARSDALRLLEALAGPRPRPLWRVDDDIEPLYVERVARVSSPEDGPMPGSLQPVSLQDLIGQQVRRLTQTQRRILLALKILGLYDAQLLGSLPGIRGEPSAALAPLIEKGWIETNAGLAHLRHPVYGDASLAAGSAMSVAAIHREAARELRSSRELVELRAFHAIHGPADFEAFLLLEDAARLRAARGDKEGVIRALSHAVTAARAHWVHGETETASTALSVFGRKLAAALVSAGRMEEAQGILDEILQTTESRDYARAALLDQCAVLADLRGRAEIAQRHRREALKIAVRSGDRKLAERLGASLSAGPPARAVDPLGDEQDAPPPSPPPDRPRRSVLIVEDDPAIREALQSAIEAESYVTHSAANGREALDILSRVPRPGLILLDLMMPVMSGWELLERLRADEDLSEIPVVVVSAVIQNDEISAARVLKKPVELNTLLSVVEELCE